MKLIHEKESWFKMPHALIDSVYPTLSGDAVKTHIVVTRWTHGLKNQKTTTSMTLGQIDEKCGFGNWKGWHAKAHQELDNLERNGLIKIHKERGKTNRIEILRPEYETLKKRVDELQNEMQPPTKNGSTPPPTKNGSTPPTKNGSTLPQTTTKYSRSSIDSVEDRTACRDKERIIHKGNCEIMMDVFESHMVHANKYQRMKDGRKRSVDIDAFWDMLTVDRVDFNDIMLAIKYVYEGEGGWWASKITNASTFRKNFPTIYGQCQESSTPTAITGWA